MILMMGLWSFFGVVNCSSLFASFSAFLWQLMRFNMLQLLKNLRFHSHGKEIADADILSWVNKKVKSTGRTSQIESFKVILEAELFSPWILEFLFIFANSMWNLWFRIRDYLMEYSSSSFWVQWNQGWSIGILWPRAKVVRFWYRDDGLLG